MDVCGDGGGGGGGGDPCANVRFTSAGVLQVRVPRVDAAPEEHAPAAASAACGAGALPAEADGDAPHPQPPPLRPAHAATPHAAAPSRARRPAPPGSAARDPSPAPERWAEVRGCVRYVTQRPWARMPVDCKTIVMNPLVACLAGALTIPLNIQILSLTPNVFRSLAGGRNKIVAAKAYESYNSELAASGLAIHTPLTVRDVEFGDLAGWVAKLGGFACIKVPYSNAGQGVYTITCDEEARAAGGWCFACVRSDAI